MHESTRSQSFTKVVVHLNQIGGLIAHAVS